MLASEVQQGQLTEIADDTSSFVELGEFVRSNSEYVLLAHAVARAFSRESNDFYFYDGS